MALLDELAVVLDAACGEARQDWQQAIGRCAAGGKFGERDVERRRERLGESRIGDREARAQAVCRVEGARRFAGFPSELHKSRSTNCGDKGWYSSSGGGDCGPLAFLPPFARRGAEIALNPT